MTKTVYTGQHCAASDVEEDAGTMPFYTGRHRAAPEVINGYVVEELAKMLYHARSMSRTEPTDEEWERHAINFPSTHRILMEDARREAEEDILADVLGES